MDRYWLLTSTFYGTWLSGDARGFVSRVRDARPDDPTITSRIEHNIPGTPCDEDLPGLYLAALKQMKGPPITIHLEQASALLGQFQETAVHRGWELVAVAIMSNHVHWIVGVPDDPEPSKILGDLKAYGSRPLTARWGKPPSETWWTRSGSKRILKDQEALRAVIRYLRNQFNPLIVWVAPGWDGVA